MKIDYEKWAREAYNNDPIYEDEDFHGRTIMHWDDLDSNYRESRIDQARAVITASGLLKRVEELEAALEQTVCALQNVDRHKGLLAGERGALRVAREALKQEQKSTFNPEGLRDQTGIENRAWKE